MAAEPHTPLPWHQSVTSSDKHLVRNTHLVEAWLASETNRALWDRPNGLLRIELRVTGNHHDAVVFGVRVRADTEAVAKHPRLPQIAEAMNDGPLRRVVFDFQESLHIRYWPSYLGRHRKHTLVRYIVLKASPELRRASRETVLRKLVRAALDFGAACDAAALRGLRSPRLPTTWGCRVL